MEFPRAKIILDRSKATREEWLALHDQHLGGSDAGAVMGLSQYDTPLSTFVIKKGLAPHKKENDSMRWGNLLESLIRREFVKDFEAQEGGRVVVHEDPYMYESLEHPFMCLDLDGLVSMEMPKQSGLQTGLLEIKTTTRASMKYWKDDQIPDRCYAQVQHGMKVLDLPFALVVCLMNKTLLWRTVPRKEVFIQEMVKLEKRFWKDFYLADQMPGPSGQDTDTDLLLELYPRADNTLVDLGHSPDVERYLELKEEIAVRKEEQELAKQKILLQLGGAHRAVADEHKISRVTFEKQTFDTSLFRREHPKIAERYTKSVTVDFPRIN